ncbi:SNF2 family N-terminal domain containing protein [Fonsecaea pedrosoi]|nr:SNF2 family N-terminal domain containing protein [Fonsecaea pedrosoi]
MDNVTDPALLAEIEDLRDEIALKEAILQSLDENNLDNSEDEELKHTTQKELRGLQKHIRGLLATSKREHNDGLPHRILDQSSESATAQRSGSQHSHDAQLQGSGLSSHLMPPPHHELVNRKRYRQDSLDNGRPESSKSRRTSPSPGSAHTAAPSPTASSASLSSLDDPFADPLFRGFSRDEVVQNQDYWKRREHQKQQEENDARLAQQLSQEWSQDSGPDVTQPIAPRQSEYTQSFFKTDGSINRLPASQPSFSQDITRPLPPVKPEPLTSTTQLLTSAAFEATGSKASPGFTSTTAMPGAFPTGFPHGQPYGSIGGSQVYNLTPSIPSIPSNYLTISDSSDDEKNPSSGNGRPKQSLADPSFSTPYGNVTYGGYDSYGAYGPYTSYGYRDEAQTQEQLKELLQHIRPDEELTADHIPQQPPGLKATLMPHQLSGLAWMKRMEEGTNKGGILADDMGLGKTLQSIALMLERPPADNKPCPTLVVAPVALMHQWKREIEKMVRPRYRLNVFILHGESRKITWTALKAYDVVLTTYGLLTSELKRKLALDEKAKKLKDWQPSVAEDCPILGDRSKFHRVILDEAQNIKNRNAKSALAACRIQAEHRWALTGTPMQNSTEEIFSLIKFTRIPPYNNWEHFRKRIGAPLRGRYENDKDVAMKALQALLRAILLRRTKQSKIHGQPILQLPPKETREDRVAFDKDQLDFYKALETSAQIQVNKYLQKGTLGRNYSHALVLLLRLRQACCHPALVIASKDFIQLPGGELDTDALIRNAEQLDAKVVARLKELDAYECPICFDVTENPSVFFCGHAICGDCLNQLVDQASNDNNGGPPVCPQCRARIDVNNVTDYTSFLRVHCPDRVEGQERKEDNADSNADSDSDDDSSDDSDEGDDLDGFVVYDDVEDDSEDEENENSKKRSSKSKSKKGKERSRSRSRPRTREPLKSLAQLRKEGLRNKAAKRQYLKRLKKNFHPSAKITRTVELLEEIKNSGENEKTIIFSNFTSFLDLVELPLWKHKDFSKYVRYDGSMSAKDRNDAVLEFTDNPNCKVILVSLKAGNAGLNLTVANHVIMLDPFWNPFVEYQAADRCYRIGQTKNVTIHRVLIGEGDSKAVVDPSGFTVEDRILQLQERKRDLVETALDETAGREVSRLGVRELGYLFGLNAL